jgi:hypothetical protein
MKQVTFVAIAFMSVGLIFSGCSKSADTSSNTTASTDTSTSAGTTESTASTSAAAAVTIVSAAPDGNASSPEANAASPDADASAPVNISGTDGSMSFTQGNRSASYGKGTADDVKSAGLPLYSGVDPADTTVIKGSDSNEKAITVTATTEDDFAKVDAWYASQLGSDYKASRINFGPAQLTTFKKDLSGGDESTVVLTAAKNPKDGKPMVAIMLVSKTKP